MPKAIESPSTPIYAASPLDVNITNTVTTDTVGHMKFIEGTALITPNVDEYLIVGANPLSGSWRIRRVEFTSRSYAAFEFYHNATIIKNGLTSPIESNGSMPVEPWVEVLPADNLTVIYKQTDGIGVNVSARIYYTEHP